MWLDGRPGRGIFLTAKTGPRGERLPGYEVELQEPGHCTTGDELELVHALADAFDRWQRQESERADTEPPPDTLRDALVDDAEPRLNTCTELAVGRAATIEAAEQTALAEYQRESEGA